MRLPASIGFLASTMLCTTGTAFAQGDPPAQPGQQADDDTNIVVTATRRAENLQDVPIAITALGTQTLDELQVDNFDDYARFVPSLSTDDEFTFARPQPPPVAQTRAKAATS